MHVVRYANFIDDFAKGKGKFRMNDNGILGNHRIFWSDENNSKGEVNPNSKRTITELAYIPNSVKDGFYFLNIQIPHFVCDAAPSRPLLCKTL